MSWISLHSAGFPKLNLHSLNQKSLRTLQKNCFSCSKLMSVSKCQKEHAVAPYLIGTVICQWNDENWERWRISINILCKRISWRWYYFQKKYLLSLWRLHICKRSGSFQPSFNIVTFRQFSPCLGVNFVAKMLHELKNSLETYIQDTLWKRAKRLENLKVFKSFLELNKSGQSGTNTGIMQKFIKIQHTTHS